MTTTLPTLLPGGVGGYFSLVFSPTISRCLSSIGVAVDGSEEALKLLTLWTLSSKLQGLRRYFFSLVVLALATVNLMKI